jgi:hypothetical protein
MFDNVGTSLQFGSTTAGELPAVVDPGLRADEVAEWTNVPSWIFAMTLTALASRRLNEECLRQAARALRRPVWLLPVFHSSCLRLWPCSCRRTRKSGPMLVAIH